jgi:alpha-tubulin suppressor-like RCC1 family protein
MGRTSIAAMLVMALACQSKTSTPAESSTARDAARPTARTAPVDAVAAPALGPPLRDWKDPPREDGPPRATQISLGGGFGCARMSDDSLRCWGDNSGGQLGVPRTPTRASDVVTPPITNVVEISAALTYACARKRDHSVWCWGSGSSGQLGAPGTQVTHEPVHIAGITDAVALSAGLHRACAIQRDGSLWCWGGREHDDERSDVPTPAAVDRVIGITVHSNACAVRDDDTLWCWGVNQERDPTEVDVTDVVAASAGGPAPICAVRRDGTVHCWGFDDAGQLGRGEVPAATSRPEPAPVAGLKNAVAVATELSHACAIDRAGAVWCWGAHWANPAFPPACMRTRVVSGSGGSVRDVWKYCPTATRVPGIEQAVGIALRRDRGGCALDRAGRIHCWDGTGVTPLPLDG